MSASVTIFTAHNPQRLSKRWRRVGSTYEKDPAGQIVEGLAEQVQAASPSELANLIDALSANQALSAGIANSSPATIVASSLTKAQPDAISRTREYFQWLKGPGWMLLDYDPQPNAQPFTIEQLRQVLIEVCPELEAAPMCGYYSGSSWIKDLQNNRWATENAGIHLWVLVTRANQIHDAGQRLSDHLWLAGKGYMAVSKSGALLERCLIDTSVWQPERLIFSARPVCTDDLVCDRPDPVVWNESAGAIDLESALPKLTSQQQQALCLIKSQFRNNPSLQRDVIAAREAWLEARMKSLPQGASDMDRLYLRQDLLRAVQDQVLVGDFELVAHDGNKVLVADLLSAPERWDYVRFCDPLEPYRDDGDMRIAFARTVGVLEPFLYSHAHGGMRFALGARREVLNLIPGDEGMAAEKIARNLADKGFVYRRDCRILNLKGGDLRTVNLPMIKGLIEGMYRLVKFNASSGKPRVISCPDDLAQRVLTELPSYCRPLRALVTYPVMRPDGIVLNTPGYDIESGLYYAPKSGEGRKVPVLKDDEELRKAVNRIWSPFRDMCFKTDADRSMYLALLFTTMIRPALETAPGFLIRAHMPGTGKTLLSKAALAVVGATTAMSLADTDQPEEFAKRIGTAVRSGAPVIVFDNLTGVLQNPELNSVLTSDRFQIRRLGSNDPEQDIEIRSLWIFNGNNVAPSADMTRRLLPISLDAGVEHPELRHFDSCPVAAIQARCEAYQDDLLAIMQLYHAEGAPVIETAVTLGSYGDWDRQVRQLILWLGQKGVLSFKAVDVANVVRSNALDDPERIAYTALLEAALQLHGDHYFTLSTLTTAHDGVFSGSDLQKMEASRALSEAAAELAPARQGQTYNAQALGTLLSRKVGQITGGLVLERGPKSRFGMRYRVVRR